MAGGNASKLYFKRAGALAQGFGAPFPNLMLVSEGGKAQEDLWNTVPEVKPDPEPEDPWWMKVAQWLYDHNLRWLGDLVVWIFNR
jgi:hypothetical protein